MEPPPVGLLGLPPLESEMVDGTIILNLNAHADAPDDFLQVTYSNLHVFRTISQ